MKKNILLKLGKKLEISILGEYNEEKRPIYTESFLIEKIEINKGTLYEYTEFMEGLSFKYKKGKADDIWVQLEELCLENINNNK